MDELSIKLNRSAIRRNIGGHFINHWCYANDLGLISISSVDMLNLYNKTFIEGILHPEMSEFYFF